MKRLAVLISGRGSNLRAIAGALAERQWPGRIVAVISDRPAAAGLAWAAGQGLPTEVVDPGVFPRREAFDDALTERVDHHRPDFVILAGFMRLLGARFVAHFRDRLVNIHPSLLPAFPGLHTHRRALEAGVAFHGATVHLVSEQMDGGPILAQAALPVPLEPEAAGTEAAAGGQEAAAARLAERVLRAEHLLYPTVIGWLLTGRLRLAGGGASWHALPGDEGPPRRWLWLP